MMEEHFMRSWNQGHDRFSADLHRGLTRLLAPLRRKPRPNARSRSAREMAPAPGAVEGERREGLTG